MFNHKSAFGALLRHLRVSIMTEQAETPVVEIVPITITIASHEDVVSAMDKLEELRELDIETRVVKPITNTGKFVLAAHAAGDATEEDLKKNFQDGNITFEHSKQVRADFGSVFKTLYNYTLSLNVPELSGLEVETSGKKKGDSLSNKTFKAIIAAGGSVEKSLTEAMASANGKQIPRSNWKYTFHAETKKVSMAVRKADGFWTDVDTGDGYAAPGGLTYKAKQLMGYLP